MVLTGGELGGRRRAKTGDNGDAWCHGVTDFMETEHPERARCTGGELATRTLGSGEKKGKSRGNT